jgi:hypothetical protein
VSIICALLGAPRKDWQQFSFWTEQTWSPDVTDADYGTEGLYRGARTDAPASAPGGRHNCGHLWVFRIGFTKEQQRAHGFFLLGFVCGCLACAILWQQAAKPERA